MSSHLPLNRLIRTRYPPLNFPPPRLIPKLAVYIDPAVGANVGREPCTDPQSVLRDFDSGATICDGRGLWAWLTRFAVRPICTKLSAAEDRERSNRGKERRRKIKE